MRSLNKLLLDTTTVALSQTTDELDLEHMFALDAMISIAAANPANKTFTADDATDVATTPSAHGYTTGMKCQLTTTGTLPAGLSPATDYYAIVTGTTTLKFATSQANALAGTAVDITDAGSGTHTIAVTTTIAGSVKFQKCNDPDTVPSASRVWFDVASSSQNFTGATTLNWTAVDVGYRRVRSVVTVTSGTVTAKVRLNGKGA